MQPLSKSVKSVRPEGGLPCEPVPLGSLGDPGTFLLEMRLQFAERQGVILDEVQLQFRAIDHEKEAGPDSVVLAGAVLRQGSWFRKKKMVLPAEGDRGSWPLLIEMRGGPEARDLPALPCFWG